MEQTINTLSNDTEEHVITFIDTMYDMISRVNFDDAMRGVDNFYINRKIASYVAHGVNNYGLEAIEYAHRAMSKIIEAGVDKIYRIDYNKNSDLYNVVKKNIRIMQRLSFSTYSYMHNNNMLKDFMKDSQIDREGIERVVGVYTSHYYEDSFVSRDDAKVDKEWCDNYVQNSSDPTE